MASPNAKITISLLDKTKKGFASINKSLAATRAGLNSTKGAVAGLAGAAGFGFLVSQSLAAAKELKNMSIVANTSASNLQKLGFGAETVGVSTEKFADILKDVNDKVGDFQQAGAGPLTDFFENIAPKVGLATDAFKNLSGPQALQKYYNALEQANLSQAEMTFYLEAIASDSTALIPLLKNAGEGFAEQAKRAEQLGIALSDLDVASISTLGTSLDRAKKVGKGFVDSFLVKLSPIFLGILNDFENLIIGAGGFQSAIDKAFTFAVRAAGVFANGIRGIQIAFNFLKGVASGVVGAISGSLGKLLGVVAEISGNEGLARASQAMKDFQTTAFDTFDESTSKAKELSLSILPSEVIQGKIAEYKKFGTQVIAENAKIAASNTGATGGDASEFAKKEQERIATKFALLQSENENELALNKAKLDAKLQQDINFLMQMETIRINGEEQTNQLVEQARRRHANAMLSIEQKSINDILKNQIDFSQRSELVNQNLADRQSTIDNLSAEGKKQLAYGAFRDTLAIAATGSKKLFELNKKFALADAIINGFKAIQSGFATQPFFPVGIAMGALAAVKTAAQIQGIQSQQFNGGGRKPSAGSASANIPAVQGQNANAETPSATPTVQGPQAPNKKANIIVQGELDSREKTLEFARNLVELTQDGYTDLEILIGAPV